MVLGPRGRHSERPAECRHSERPAEFRNRIVELLGDVPRIELFARGRVVGWDAWGNEAGHDVVG